MSKHFLGVLHVKTNVSEENVMISSVLFNREISLNILSNNLQNL